MPESASSDWTPARLIPTVGIRSQDEQEKRATSTLLAVMFAVPSFGRAILAEMDATRGALQTFTEVQLKAADGSLCIPDGVAVVAGRTEWKCLIEVKTGKAELEPDQVARYLDIARDHGFDGVLTISNQIRRAKDHVPVGIDKRKVRSLTLRHLSWWRILTIAVMEYRHRGVDDPDQAWILGELIEYLTNERSGASGFEDMGSHWTSVRDGARAGTLRASDPEVAAVAERWEQFVEYLCMGLSQSLGRSVSPVWPRKLTPSDRVVEAAKLLADSGRLGTAIRVPDAVGPIEVEADLRSQLVECSTSLDAPGEGRPLTRINWILRQLKEAPSDLRLDVAFVGTRETTSLLLGDAREDPKRLLNSQDAKREPRSFRITASDGMGVKRGKGRNSFVDLTRIQVADFYRETIQGLKPWTRPAAKMPEDAAIDVAPELAEQESALLSPNTPTSTDVT